MFFDAFKRLEFGKLELGKMEIAKSAKLEPSKLELHAEVRRKLLESQVTPRR